MIFIIHHILPLAILINSSLVGASIYNIPTNSNPLSVPILLSLYLFSASAKTKTKKPKTASLPIFPCFKPLEMKSADHLGRECIMADDEPGSSG